MVVEAQVAPAVLEPAQFRIVLAGLMTVLGLAVMDINIVNTALPRITSSLGGASQLYWVVTAFMLTSTVSTPLYGKLSDMYGRRRLILIALGVFLVSSALCGLAQTMLQLIGFRALQGLGAGGLIVLVQAIIGDLVSPRERGRYQGLFTSVFAIGSLAGPLVGGALTTYLSWRWIFYVNLPLGAVAMTLILYGLPVSLKTHRRNIDYIGAALLIVTTTFLLWLFNLGFSPARLGIAAVLAVVVAIGVAAFLWRERRAPEPILDLELFRNRTFSVGALTTATMAFALFAALVLLPLHLQLVLGRSPIQAALVVTPQVLGMVLSSFFGGRAVSKLGRVKPFLMLGVGLQATALWSLVLGVALGWPSEPFTLSTFLLGLGMGVGMPNAVTIVQNSIRREQMGVATGALGFVRSLGGTAGVALTGGVLTFVLQATLARHHLGGDLQAYVEHATHAATTLTAAQRAGFADAYRNAIEASLVVCAVIMSASIGSVASLPDDELRGAGPLAKGG